MIKYLSILAITSTLMFANNGKTLDTINIDKLISTIENLTLDIQRLDKKIDEIEKISHSTKIFTVEYTSDIVGLKKEMIQVKDKITSMEENISSNNKNIISIQKYKDEEKQKIEKIKKVIKESIDIPKVEEVKEQIVSTNRNKKEVEKKVVSKKVEEPKVEEPKDLGFKINKDNFYHTTAKNGLRIRKTAEDNGIVTGVLKYNTKIQALCHEGVEWCFVPDHKAFVSHKFLR